MQHMEKTTYCLWLLQNWCTAKNKDGIKDKELQSCEKAMKNFDFVFLVQLRYVDPNLDSVIDMICEDLFRDSTDCHRDIRHVLSSGKYRSLIIMDGLDEWNPNGETRKQLTCQGMPNIRVSSTVTCFISMRPWMFALISKMVKVSDRVIEILGLSETGMENVIENVLLNYYELKDDKSKFTKKYNEIVKILNVQSLKSFMQIPLLAVVCVQIWYEGKQVGDSMTSFYAEMLNMLIERALAKHELHVERNRTIDCELPQILSTHEKIVNCFPILLKFGKTAYEGLLSNDTNLVFQKSKLEKEIGMSELQFALDVGLISQREARSLTTKNVSVHFFHKSIQEFLAVIYIVTRKEVGASFCKYLCNIKVIMELSNVIMFICGMCPSLGSAISQRVVSVTDRDAKICDYRKSPGVPNSTVEELYKLQISWYRELQYGQIESQVAFHVSDVYLWPESDIETVRWTRKLLSDHLVDMQSLFLLLVPTNRENGISDTQLNDFLCNKHNNTRSLIMVRINGHDTDRTICPICIPSLRCLYLHYVKINHTYSDGNGYPPLLSDMTSLRVLQIGWVNLGVRGLELSAGMTHIEEVRLDDEKMTEVQWQQFILSVLNIQRRFNVKLFDTNIDDGSRRKIRSSPGFTVTRDGVGKHGGYEFYFTREWPIFV